MNNLIPTVYAQGIVPIKYVYSFGWIDNLGQALGFLVNPVFAIAGTIVFIFFIVGAFRMVTSNGDKNIIASSREEMTHAIIGFILLIVVFLAVKYLPAFFFGTRGGNGEVQNDSGFEIIKK